MLAQGMITVKEAVAKAIEFAQGMLGVPASEVLLEEVELGTDGPNDVWLITLSAPGRAGIAVPGRIFSGAHGVASAPGRPPPLWARVAGGWGTAGADGSLDPAEEARNRPSQSRRRSACRRRHCGGMAQAEEARAEPPRQRRWRARPACHGGGAGRHVAGPRPGFHGSGPALAASRKAAGQPGRHRPPIRSEERRRG